MTRSLTYALLVLSLGACKTKEAKEAEAAEEAATRSTPAAQDAPDPTAIVDPAKAEPSSPSTPAEKLLEWLDPEAVAVIYSKLPEEIDTNALGVVFAIPQKTTRMMRANTNVLEALEAILPLDAPRPAQWLGPEALVTTSVVSTGPYVLRPLTRPRAEVQALLESAGMQPTVTEGITILVPRGAFPWKAAFVSDEVLAFIPTREIGSGLSPLTAGRDMPPSEVEKALREIATNEPDALLELYAAGPIVHFDVGQDVLQLMLRVRRWEAGSSGRKGHALDVSVRMQLSQDPHAAEQKLEARKTPLETDQIQALVDRVAYTVEEDTVVGRLQMSPEDVAILIEAS
jgi:hypothetical protein